MALLQINDLSFTYPESSHKALDKINLAVEEGELILLIGVSGCGKSTLLRHIKRELAPHGHKRGEVCYAGVEIEHLDQRTAVTEIGFVLQNPETQIVTDRVWHELAFGLENLGLEKGEIRRKVAEMASFFGIDSWFRKSVDDLSGGQKQILNLASIMAMQPKLLLLDEPTAQLDPIAAQEFLAMIEKINRDLGVTVILSEHRLEEVFPLADRVVVMEGGQVFCADKPEKVAQVLGADSSKVIFKGLPSPIRIYSELPIGEKCPLTVREGRQWLIQQVLPNLAETDSLDQMGQPAKSVWTGNTKAERSRPALETKEIWFKYSAEGSDILRGVSLQAYAGETLCVLGGNGTGKTTLLGVLSGVLKIKRGQVWVDGKKLTDFKYGELYRHNLAMLPQNPKALFVSDTVRGDLEEAAELISRDKTVRELTISKVMEELGIEELARRHPYDLSGGEQQKAGIAKLLLLQPKVILLDEPTKGLDAYSKEGLAQIFFRLRSQGAAIVVVTHDLEFAAEYGDRCAMMFDGEIVSEGNPREFFAGNSFYTTAANRMARGIFSQAVTCKDVIKQCQIGFA
ncbi:ABC transporter ATP-binding protein [Desulfosporosinus youngiae]|uniref:ATPase component of various ABC-type transport systems with duplicated ATPase domain n=1 Tax=Desulfosporosinus youngiae DSM 17734 TaxID=768710 RepID=H5Y5R7_9FIRM|nr:ABC transporter ATP-binding protein [Desulfosporosinus youngiae]EHQ90793.1 ATPase component of various ABC-type transport systems with duplicated ATPase domain [Desulfosporosinus youngiae DSM 17734]